MAHPARALPIELLELDMDCLENCMPDGLSDLLAVGASCKALQHVCRQPATLSRVTLPSYFGTRISHEEPLLKFAEGSNATACLRLGLALIYGTANRVDEGMHLLRSAREAGGEVGAEAAFELSSMKIPVSESEAALQQALAAGHLGARLLSGMRFRELTTVLTPPLPRGKKPTLRDVQSIHARAAWDAVAVWKEASGVDDLPWQTVRVCSTEDCDRWSFSTRLNSSLARRRMVIDTLGIPDVAEPAYGADIQGPPIDIRVCAMCHTTYCSKICQKLDWMKGHKRECARLAAGDADSD